MPSPFAGFHVDVPRSPVVQLVKMLTNPKRAISKRIFICFGGLRGCGVVELTIISTERVAFFAECTLADLPRIALTDYNPRKVALFVHGSIIDVADMRLTPSSDRTYILADRI